MKLVSENHGYSPVLLKNFIVPFENKIRMKFMVMRDKMVEFEEYSVGEDGSIKEILDLCVYRAQFTIDGADADLSNKKFEIEIDPCLVIWVSDSVQAVIMPKFGG